MCYPEDKRISILEAISYAYYRDHATPDLLWHKQWVTKEITTYKKALFLEKKGRRVHANQ
jgi:hypothetical protein